MDPVSIFTIATFCVSSSLALYKKIDSLKSRKQSFRHLKAEIKNLTVVLQALLKNIEETNEDFGVLKTILEQCSRACEEFDKAVLHSLRKYEGRLDDVKIWAKLQYYEGDIDNFRKLIGNYQATITVALADANLQTSRVTRDLLEQYTELTENTASDLKDQIAQLSRKLDQYAKTRVMNGESSSPEVHQSPSTESAEGQRASLEQCLTVCRHLLDHIEEIKHSVDEGISNGSVASTGNTDVPDAYDLAPRLTTDALQMCTYNLSAVTQHLHELRTKSKAPDETDERQMVEQLNGARQCLDVLTQAQQHRVNVFQNITVAEDSLSTAVSTIGDLIRAEGFDIGPRTINIMGQMNNESLQKLGSGRQHATNEPATSREEANVAFEKKHGHGYTVHSKKT